MKLEIAMGKITFLMSKIQIKEIGGEKEWNLKEGKYEKVERERERVVPKLVLGKLVETWKP